MKIQNLIVCNFRKFREQSFVFNPRFTVLIGRNATGKTQILDALSIILSVYQTKIYHRDKAIRKIANEEIRVEEHEFVDPQGNTQLRQEEQYPVSITASIAYRNTIFEQSCSKRTSKGRTAFGGVGKFIENATREAEQIASGKSITLPFLAYYGAGRLWPLKRHFNSSSSIESRTDGYTDSLDPNTDVKEFQGWIKKQEMIHLQKQKKPVALELVQQTIAAMIPNCKSVYYDIEYDCINLKFYDGSSCPFYNLSDGFRCMVSMTADMVRRMVILNPHLGMEALKQTEGVVLIDELDLYLHPEWQRQVVDHLKHTFPCIQFIVTTHSPFIIQSLSPGEVIDLEACNGETVSIYHTLLNEQPFLASGDNAWPGPGNTYTNRSLEDIVEEIMGIKVPQRSEKYQKMYAAAREYYRILEQGKNASEEEKKLIKQQLDELSAPFSDNVAYYAFLEMERMTALKEKGKTK